MHVTDVRLSVCVSVTRLNSGLLCKTAERIEILFGGPRNTVLHGGLIPHRGGGEKVG